MVFATFFVYTQQPCVYVKTTLPIKKENVLKFRCFVLLRRFLFVAGKKMRF